MAKYKYGWKPGLPSARFPRLTLQVFPQLAAQYSLMETGMLPPEVWDQGQTSSCTGHGTTAGIMYARAKQKLSFVDLSRLFPYWNARVAEGNTADDGAAVGDVIAASQKFGDCPYPDLPTEVKLTTVAPSEQAFKDALAHKALSATRILGSTNSSFEYHFKHCLSLGELPVVFGFTVYESFESDEVAKTGVMPMPKPNEQVLGGHCVLACSYNDKTEMVRCRNSWSDAWGQKGYFDMPYAAIFNADMAADFHAITLEAA